MGDIVIRNTKVETDRYANMDITLTFNETYKCRNCHYHEIGIYIPFESSPEDVIKALKETIQNIKKMPKKFNSRYGNR